MLAFYQTMDPFILKQLYNTIVRPNLEYATQLWSPFYQIHKDRIEGVQKNFLRFALRLLPWSNPQVLPPYEERLRLINMVSLEKRREISDIIFIYQSVNNNILSPFISQQINFRSKSRFRNTNLFTTKFHRTNYGRHEPINRMLIICNKYKHIIDFSLSKDNLKNKLLRPYLSKNLSTKNKQNLFECI